MVISVFSKVSYQRLSSALSQLVKYCRLVFFYYGPVFIIPGQQVVPGYKLSSDEAYFLFTRAWDIEIMADRSYFFFYSVVSLCNSTIFMLDLVVKLLQLLFIHFLRWFCTFRHFDCTKIVELELTSQCF